jgi:glycosyltransferase involved in cell wall biosynthesis
MNGIWIFPDIAVWFAAKRERKPFGVFIHGALDPWFNRTYPLKHLKKMLYWPIQYAVLQDAAAIFFTTQTERDLARRSFSPHRWNGIVVPYGISDPEERRIVPGRGGDNGTERRKLRRGTPEEQVAGFYKILPELQGRRFLLFLGRLHEKKGCDLLIEAIARNPPGVATVDLVIAGPDHAGNQAKLRNKAEELGLAARVHWAGMLTGDAKWGALRACEAFVLPSHQENFGIAVVESLAVGRPVLISNQVNIWPAIVKDDVGLVDDDTTEGTERLLARWFDLPAAERQAMGVRARTSFIRRFAVNRTALAIRQILHGANRCENLDPAALQHGSGSHL